MIYFDNSATTPVHPQVLDTYVKASQRFIGNPSSLHQMGQKSSVLLEKSRQHIAELMSVDPSEIVFTSGGTEGNNWVIKGTAMEKRSFGKHIIVSNIEHPSVFKTAEQLKELGFEISVIPVLSNGCVDVEALKKLIREDTILVSVMAVNNEVGSIQPIRDISDCLSAYSSIHFHVDAVQAIGHVPVSEWLTERVDFATCSAHKFQGPKGVGFMYWRHGAKLSPLLTGGGQEKGHRSGTEHVPGIVAMTKALRLSLEQEDAHIRHMRHLKKALHEGLATYDRVEQFSYLDESISAPHIITFGLTGIKGEVLVHALEQKEIFVSTTSACSSKKKMGRSTLKAMGVSPQKAETAVRVSISPLNTMTEVEQFLIIFNQLNHKFSKING